VIWFEGLVSKSTVEGASSEADQQRVIVDAELLL